MNAPTSGVIKKNVTKYQRKFKWFHSIGVQGHQHIKY
jgi:hypothetical protein